MKPDNIPYKILVFSNAALEYEKFLATKNGKLLPHFSMASNMTLALKIGSRYLQQLVET